MKTFPRKTSYSVNGKKPRKTFHKPQQGPTNWIWGSHAVQAAITNPKRQITRKLATEAARKRLGDVASDFTDMSAHDISKCLPEGAVHQGIAIQTPPIPPIPLERVMATTRRLVILDQVQDPHNLGAIYRSAAAFGAGGMILQSRNAPAITGIVAKAAAGAIEMLPEIRVVNIARTIRELQEAGWYTIGLDGGQSVSVAQAIAPLKNEKLAIVIGAEGAGVRPNVLKACSIIAGIPISAQMESLNASIAAAIALYEMSKAGNTI